MAMTSARRSARCRGEPFSKWRWKKALAEGVVEGTAWKPVGLDEPPVCHWCLPGSAGVAEITRVARPALTPCPSPKRPGSDYQLIFSDGKRYDGSFANNGWLQELPTR